MVFRLRIMSERWHTDKFHRLVNNPTSNSRLQWFLSKIDSDTLFSVSSDLRSS